jgi:hypothetical protein
MENETKKIWFFLCLGCGKRFETLEEKKEHIKHCHGLLCRTS